MKAIMISIKPKWVAKILNGEKTIEIRKTMPKCDLPIDVYIYCTKDNKQRLYPVALLDKSNQVFKRAYREDKIDNRTNYLNGKVVAKFTLNKVEEIDKYQSLNPLYTIPACLTSKEWCDYFGEKGGYALHISDLEIFDKPKELSEFYKNGSSDYINNCPKRLRGRCNGVGSGLKTTNCIKKEDCKLTKAPQSWCYVEVEE